MLNDLSKLKDVACIVAHPVSTATLLREKFKELAMVLFTFSRSASGLGAHF
jgi:hypothetical protein